MFLLFKFLILIYRKSFKDKNLSFKVLLKNMSERRVIHNSFLHPWYCPECNRECNGSYFKDAALEYALTCEEYHEDKRQIRCSACKVQFEICMTCLAHFESKQSKSNKIKRNEVFEGYFSLSFKKVILAVLLLLLLIYYIFNFTRAVNSDENLKIINELRKRYPSQKNETWYHFLSALERGVPTVKSVTFLHGEDQRTLRFLTDELVSLYTKNQGVKLDEITFYSFEYDTKDYGVLLERCRQIVKRFRIFITDLNKVNGNTARIFHALCDEVSSDIKPSLFIFTLMYNKRMENMKPVEKATAILKEAWNDLPENEIFPLLSRIVKNVIDIIPEKQNIL